MKKLIFLVLILCLFFVSNLWFSQENQEAEGIEALAEVSAKEVIYRIAFLRAKKTEIPALQRARKKVIKNRVNNEVTIFALRLKLNDFDSEKLSGSIESEDMKVALLALVKPFYSFLEKEYECNLNLMIEESPGFSDLLRLAEGYGLIEDSSEKESNDDSLEEEVIVNPF